MQMKDAYNATSAEIGDVMAYTIKFHVTQIDLNTGMLFLKVYKCPWDYPELADGIPQGLKISMSKEALIQIFPILRNYKFEIVG